MACLLSEVTFDVCLWV